MAYRENLIALHIGSVCMCVVVCCACMLRVCSVQCIVHTDACNRSSSSFCCCFFIPFVWLRMLCVLLSYFIRPTQKPVSRSCSMLFGLFQFLSTHIIFSVACSFPILAPHTFMMNKQTTKTYTSHKEENSIEKFTIYLMHRRKNCARKCNTINSKWIV